MAAEDFVDAGQGLQQLPVVLIRLHGFDQGTAEVGQLGFEVAEVHFIHAGH
jgi:hypothetical protein